MHFRGCTSSIKETPDGETQTYLLLNGLWNSLTNPYLASTASNDGSTDTGAVQTFIVGLVLRGTGNKRLVTDRGGTGCGQKGDALTSPPHQKDFPQAKMKFIKGARELQRNFFLASDSP